MMMFALGLCNLALQDILVDGRSLPVHVVLHCDRLVHLDPVLLAVNIVLSTLCGGTAAFDNKWHRLVWILIEENTREIGWKTRYVRVGVIHGSSEFIAFAVNIWDSEVFEWCR